MFISPKRELRAVWIATVGNIDWPSKQGLSAQQQQIEFIRHLDFLKLHGFNAVIVQVRPAADAFYESSYEPWSRYLSGKQGQPPFPKYDPLEFMIEETHKRNMEFHAWFNPFRALVKAGSNPNPPDHATRKHPEWILNYGGKSYFDPGNPQAREYVLKVILEAVAKYDFDAVHIDDYFYPYRIAGVEFPDAQSYGKYNSEDLNRDDWRRNNVNLFISMLSMIMKKEKPWVQLGISPFGVWRNDSKDPEGSATRAGQTCYDDLYSDVKLWMKKGWIDYIAPQLYWEHGHRAAPYEVLLPWWKRVSTNTDLYIGLGVYRMLNATKAPWNKPDEILKQIQAAREKKTQGVILYSMSNFNKIPSHLADSLRLYYFGKIAIPPAKQRHDKINIPVPIAQLVKTNIGIKLSWTSGKIENERMKFLIYRFEENEKIDLNDAAKIIALTQANQFIDKDAQSNLNVKYVITTLDRLWNESKPSNIVTTYSENTEQ